MSNSRNDPLLLAGKVLAIFMQGILAIVGVILALLTPVIVIFQDKINAEIQADHADVLTAFPAWSLAGMFLLIVVAIVLVFIFFGKLRAIIETVGQGDPFVPENAERLTSMAWLLFTAQLMAIPMAAIGLHIASWAQQLDDNSFEFDVGPDVTGILMVIVLFILARVFRHGAAMRDDLEGTV